VAIDNPKPALESLRQRLLARRAELRDLWRDTLADEDQLVQEREPDWEDLASLQGAADLLDKLGDREVDELFAITRALNKIETNSYGTCEECDAPIAARRLELLPYTPYCVTCAEQLEQEGAESRAAGWAESGPER
jgi:DnaK suppressor protein